MTPPAAHSTAIISLKNVQESIIRNCAPPKSTDTFLNVAGALSKTLTLFNNNFQGVTTVVIKDGDVGENVIKALYNY